MRLNIDASEGCRLHTRAAQRASRAPHSWTCRASPTKTNGLGAPRESLGARHRPTDDEPVPTTAWRPVPDGRTIHPSVGDDPFVVDQRMNLIRGAGAAAFDQVHALIDPRGAASITTHELDPRRMSSRLRSGSCIDRLARRRRRSTHELDPRRLGSSLRSGSCVDRPGKRIRAQRALPRCGGIMPHAPPLHVPQTRPLPLA